MRDKGDLIPPLGGLTCLTCVDSIVYRPGG